MAQLIPQNQLDSLPLLTVASVGAPGDVNVVGGVLTRFYDAAAVGFPSEFVNLATGGSALISNPLDMRGCRAAVLVLTRQVTGAPGDASRTYQPYILYQTSGGAQEDMDLAGILPTLHRTLGDLAIPAALGINTKVFSIALSDALGQATGGGSGIILSADGIRFALRDGLNNPGSQIWNGEVWGVS